MRGAGKAGPLTVTFAQSAREKPLKRASQN